MVRANLFAMLVGLLCVAGCGGGGSSISGGGSGGGGSGGGGTTTGSNVQSVTVDSGPTVVANSNSPAVNTLYTTVTICAPGSTTTCQTIDHIQVDTGSSGLRILSSALSISLPVQTDASGNAIAECVGFVDGSSWGVIRQADVKIGGESAAGQRVQVIGDATYAVPGSCNATEDDVTHFGANGILGVSAFVQDCGGGCTVLSSQEPYYTCPGTAGPCSQSATPLSLQVANPVASFATDNNGVIIDLPATSGTSQASLTGSLIFGIGTQSNNGLGSAAVYVLSGAGYVTANFNGNQLADSFIDSGSNAWYFPDSNIHVCNGDGMESGEANATGFFCPSATTALTVSITDAVAKTSPAINFSIVNASTLFKGTGVIAVAPNLAGSSLSVSDPSTSGSFDGSNSFDFGLPFHYGRRVYTAIEGQNTSAGAGPYTAF